MLPCTHIQLYICRYVYKRYWPNGQNQPLASPALFGFNFSILIFQIYFSLFPYVQLLLCLLDVDHLFRTFYLIIFVDRSLFVVIVFVLS